MDKKEYYIGIDGGGTKTKFSLFDRDKQLIKSVVKPTIHPAQVTQEDGERILLSGKEELLSGMSPLEYNLKAGAGLGGYGINEEYRNKLERMFKRVFISGFKLYSDAYAAMTGALAGEDGILVIAGTGSIALANVADKSYRCGGFGYRFGDEGSAYSIGKELISVMLKQSDGRMEKSEIYSRVSDYFNMRAETVATSDFSREKIAGLAAELAHLIESDRTVKAIFNKAADEITLHIRALKSRFHKDEKIKVSYIGGVFKSDYVLENIRLKNPDITIIAPIYPPEKGAILEL